MWHGTLKDDAKRTRLLHEAIDLGFAAIDTAPLYGFGVSEEHLGRALVGHREGVLLLTKVGLRWDSSHGEVLFEATVDGRPRCVRRDSRPEAVRRDVEGSLSRLGTDRLDLVQVHHMDEATPVEETIGELLRLQGEGKLRFIGVCNHDSDALRRCATALGRTPLVSAQEHYSLVTRSIETEVLPTLSDLEVGLLAYSPLEQGILGGRLLGPEPERPPTRSALFQPKNAGRINAVLREVAEPIAKGHGVGLSQVALGWLLLQPGVDAVICGASRSEQLIQNAAATRLALTADEVSTLSAAFAGIPIDWNEGASPAARIRQLVRRKAAGLRRRIRGDSG